MSIIKRDSGTTIRCSRPHLTILKGRKEVVFDTDNDEDFDEINRNGMYVLNQGIRALISYTVGACTNLVKGRVYVIVPRERKEDDGSRAAS